MSWLSKLERKLERMGHSSGSDSTESSVTSPNESPHRQTCHVQPPPPHYNYGEERQLHPGRSPWCFLIISFCIVIGGLVIGGLVFWLVCHPSAPKVHVNDIKFQNFFVVVGKDPTGVPSQLVFFNCTTMLHFENPSKYFGFHFSAPKAFIYYEWIRLASGKSKKFLQQKRSTSVTKLSVDAVRTPVYGAGLYLLSDLTSKDGLSLQLRIEVHSYAYVIWKMVVSKYKSSIVCNLILDTNDIMANNGVGPVKIFYQKCQP